MKLLLRTFCLMFCVLFVSCSNSSLSQMEKLIKYREKNLVSILNLVDIKGNVSIQGWGEDFIEINTKKRLLKGLSSDLQLIDTSFYLSQNNQCPELNIKTRIPARLDAQIDLTIFVPYSLSNIHISQQFGNLEIKKFFGDMYLSLQKGSQNIDFQGNVLRFEANKSKSNINISCTNSADIVFIGDNSEYNVTFHEVPYQSYCDIITDNSNVNVLMNENIAHSLNVINTDKKINVKYQLNDINIFNGDIMKVSGTVGHNPSRFFLDIITERGRVGMTQFKSENLNYRFF